MQRNKISVLTAALINVNIMVGIGIFINPPMMALKAGWFSFLGWGLSALVFLPVVVSIAKISSIFPEAGSFYNYSKNGIGRFAGFLSGWLYFLAYVAIQAMQTIALKELIVSLFGLEFISNYPAVFYALFLVTLSLMSFLNIEVVGRIVNTTTTIKLIPILFVCLLTPFFLGGSSNVAVSNFSLLDVRFTLPLAIFGFWGFEVCTSVSHLIKGGKGSASRAVLLGFGGVALIYTIFHFGIIQIMGLENLKAFGVQNFVEFLNIKSFYTKWIISNIITIAILVSYIGSTFGLFATQSFLLNAMAKEKLLFLSKFIERVNTHGQPVNAIIVQTVIAFLFTLTNNLYILLAIGNLGIIFAFTLTLISLLLMQIKNNANLAEQLTTALSFASCATIGYYSALGIGDVRYALPFIAIAIVGVVMFKAQDR